jgi:hypothetical protein
VALRLVAYAQTSQAGAILYVRTRSDDMTAENLAKLSVES